MGRLDMDIHKGKTAATALYEAFAELGIHGRTQMPEDLMPDGMIKGSGKHVRFVTLTLSIDYQRDANALWDSARRTYEDAATQYLFDPRALHEASNHKVREDMRKHSLSKKPDKDAWIWRTVGVTFFKKWHGDPELFLAHCYWHGPTILRRLKEDTHYDRTRPMNDYPFLRDIDFLRYDLGAPIAYDPRRRGYVYTEPNWVMPSVRITEGELFALMVAEKGTVEIDT